MVNKAAINNAQIIKNKLSTVELLSNGIVYIYYHENALLKSEDFDDVVAAYKQLSHNKPLKVLSEFGAYATATPAARKHAALVRVSCIAEAAVFKGLAQRMLLKFHILLRKQPHPFKIFQSKQNAINWLNSKTN